jgi:hypothetical protein
LFLVPGGDGQLAQRRYAHTATLLKTGRDVFVAGGFNEAGPATTPEVVRIEANDVRTVTASAAVGVGAIFHAAGLSDEDGRVILGGGYGSVADAEPQGGLPQRPSANVEMWLFNDATGTLTRDCTAQINTARGYHTVTMAGRRAVFAGGRDSTGATTASAEVATLTSGPSCFATLPVERPMADNRAQHTSVTLGTGEILVVGGLTQAVGQQLWTSVSAAEVFSPARTF